MLEERLRNKKYDKINRMKSLAIAIVLLPLSIFGVGLGIAFILQAIGLDQTTSGIISSQLGVIVYGLSLYQFNFKGIKESIKPKFSFKVVGVAIFSVFLIMIANFTISLLIAIFIKIPDITNLPNNTETILNSKSILTSVFFPVIVAPIAEEFAFRGGLKYALVDKGGFHSWSYIFISSFIFGLIHWQPGVMGITNMAITGFIGLVLGYIYSKNENIVTTILAHMFYNATILGMAAVVTKLI